MTLHILTTYTAPEFEDHRRRVNEARAAAFWAVLGPVRRATGWIGDGISALLAGIARRKRHTKDLRLLQRMSLHELEDIGLNHADLLAFEANGVIDAPAAKPGAPVTKVELDLRTGPEVAATAEPRAGRTPLGRKVRSRGRFRKAAA